ncbi:hypothetical protein ABZ820_12615 [Streptomyces diacarni]|uniref:hypothetical protein n=1 Tax=Streptomyces diacarni TaxID=2800381 RepID=UPI0033DB5953
MTTRRGANHGLHLVLTLLTCGIWAITGWPIAAIMGRKTKTRTYAPVQPPAPRLAPPHQQYGSQAYAPYPNQQQAPPYGTYPPPGAQPYGQQGPPQAPPNP